MLIVDWIFLVIIILFALIGFLVGFGRGLRFFTRGFFGFLISVFVCYSLGGLIIHISFVADLLTRFRGVFVGKEAWYFKLLLAIRIDVIVYYIVLFIIVQIVRIIIVKIISRVFEINNIVLKFINRLFGIVLFLFALVVLTMIVFQVIYWIGGNTAASFTEKISGSALKIDWFYEHNPLTKIIEILFKITIKIEVPVEVPAT